MLMPSIFNKNLFDDFFDFPFYDDKAEKKLYGHHAANLMKTDIQEHDDGYTLEMHGDRKAFSQLCHRKTETQRNHQISLY